jgi:D-3-phosphoglycerate dehydrogenase
VTGTVLGSRHIRMIELDEMVLDRDPEGPLLATFHRDVPGVVGRIGTILGEAGVNISRLQLGGAQNGQGLAFAIWNLAKPLPANALDRVRAESSVVRAHRIDI